MEKNLKDKDVSNNYLLAKLKVVDQEIITLRDENQRLHRLNRNLQNQRNWNVAEETSKFHKKQELLIFKRRVAENKARTQKYIVHLKKENAEIIEDLKRQLQSYKHMCNKFEKDEQILKIKVTRLQDELNYMGTKTYHAREKRIATKQRGSFEMSRNNSS